MRDAVLLRRSAMVLHTLLVVAAAYAGALAVNAAVAFWLESGVPSSSGASITKAATDHRNAAGKRADYSVIFDRNLFGSEPIAAVARGPAPTSSAVLSLRGIASLDGNGFAVFEEGESGRQDVFSIGDRVFDGPRLVMVGPDSATLLHKGRRIRMEIEEADEADAEASAEPEAAGGIRKTGDSAFLVDRREVDHSIENLNTVITQMRAVPFMRDGKSLGFRLFNIRPGSVFERMGLKNGDVVQNVNGVELTSPSKALALLEDVQTAEEIRVDFMRNNEPNTFTYTIR